MEVQEDLTTPTHRAAIRAGAVSIVDWDPRLSELSDLSRAALTRATVYADLRFVGNHGDHDVIVRATYPARLDDESREVLTAWASTTGHRRIWFSEQVVDLHNALPPQAVAVCCTWCGALAREESFEFWAHVRGQGSFPNRCRACGWFVKQWVEVKGSQVGASERPFA